MGAGARVTDLTPAEGLSGRVRDRVLAAFAAEERSGLLVAGQVRSVGVTLILIWTLFRCPCSGTALAYESGVALVFLFSGLAHLILVWRRHCPNWLTRAFITLDCAFLGFVMVTPNPFVGVPIDPLAYISNSYFVLFYLLLMQATFSYQVRLVVHAGAMICLTWLGVMGYALSLPGAFSEASLPGTLTFGTLVSVYYQPHFVYIGEWVLQILVTAIITAGLSLVVYRARHMALSRAMAERARSNLARYFAPGIVDLVEDRGREFGRMKRQDVAALFIDIRGFTAMAETMAPEAVMALLRQFHARMESAVFDHGGMLEKYIGDAMLAIFGAPQKGARDAADALACARAMLDAMDDWNRDRQRAGEETLAIGIGLTYGPAVQGDIGTARAVAFAVIGDTINTCSRLQALAGHDGHAAVIADDLVSRVRAELGPEADQALAGLSDLGWRQLRGRAAPIRLWGLAGPCPEIYRQPPEVLQEEAPPVPPPGAPPGDDHGGMAASEKASGDPCLSPPRNTILAGRAGTGQGLPADPGDGAVPTR